jgi:hypothetical protein
MQVIIASVIIYKYEDTFIETEQVLVFLIFLDK